MPVLSGWTGSLLECAKAVAGAKLIPVPLSLKGRLAAWLNFSGAARSRPVPGSTTASPARMRVRQRRREVDDTAAGRTQRVHRGDGHRLAVRGSAHDQLVAYLERNTDPADLGRPAAADSDIGRTRARIGRERRASRLRTDASDRDGFDSMAHAVDV